MADRYFKFKNVKYSARMRLVRIEPSSYVLEHESYKGMLYFAKPSELVEVTEDESTK